MRKQQVCFLIVCLAVWLPLTGFAQKDTERRYRAGVKAVQLGEYDRARSDLQVVMQRDGSFAPFAYYYHAVASVRQKRFEAARATLKQLIDKYPNWLKKEEAYYLAASAAFEQSLFDEAFSYTNLISDPELRREVDRMEAFFLPRIGDLNRLKALQKQYPADRTLALTLVELIQRTSSEKSDLELSDRLSNRFGLSSPPPAPSRPTPPAAVPATPQAPATAIRQKNKGYYNVGVLFPFRVDRLGVGDRARSNQYVYDLYEGMKLAKSKLLAEGITINLFAYDSDNDTDETLELLNNASFAQNDLLIGPIYAEPNKLVSAFAVQNNIPLVNPIATSRDLIANLPNAYLAQPSTVQQAIETVRFVKGLNENRRAAVYFGAARKDSLLASAYQTELKAQGFQVVDFRKLTGNGTDMATAMRINDMNRPGHVFFASSNDDDGPRMLSALSSRGVTGPLIATYPAFDYFRNSLSTFTRRELYLVAPEFMDMSREATEAFQETYLSRRNIIPSVFSAWGYDMLLFFGRQLAKNALKNRTSLQTEPDNDYVLSGFDYTRSNDNQVVPIVKFDGARFIRANQ
ncbi:ABC transporter substrate-binding protein [Fibrella aestuarina]|nr:ABC transporter substrate-binding protein [Fibrella aestuarina]